MNGQPRTVLMILYYFPPTASGGTYRPLKFIRYLPEFGWRSIVVAPYDNPFEAEDYSLLSEVPYGTKIHRVVNGIESSWHYRLLRKLGYGSYYDDRLLPDRHIKFVENAIKKAENILSFQKVDLIFTSVPPYSLHIAGRDLSQKFGIPWVADFRDPWVSCPFYKYASERVNKLNKNLKNKAILRDIKFREIEKSYFQRASAIISFPESRAVIERTKYPEFAGKIVSIENGYDPSDFPETGPVYPKDSFRIVHIGSITRDRPVTIFLRALRGVISRNNEIRKKVGLEFIGSAREPTRTDVRQLKLEEITRFRGYLSHRETCVEMMKADLLFMVLPNLEKAGEIMPLRLFEYIYSRRPVFLIAPKGGTSDFFQKANAGVWVDYNSENSITDKLYDFIVSIISGKYKHNPNLDVLSGYDRRSLTRKLADLFDKICAGGPILD